MKQKQTQMLIYLDNCCFNRPFDNQKDTNIRIETEAKLIIQEEVFEGRIRLAWSYILDFENSENPFPERRDTIALWKKYAAFDTGETNQLLEIAKEVSNFGVKPKDSLHVASSVTLACEYFITTDISLISKLSNFNMVRVVNPVDFVNTLKT